MTLISRGKAEKLQNGRGVLRSVSMKIRVPSVIRLVYMVRCPLMQRRISRRAVFHPDGSVCQYCGSEVKNLTLDHIVPRSKGGVHAWENVVAACIPCNHSKVGRTPREAGMWLIQFPKGAETKSIPHVLLPAYYG